MITAVFTDNSDYARATGLWQWDYGQRLRIEGLHLPTAVEIHFALTEFAGDAITRVGTTKDGVTEVVIPDSLLENQAAGATYEIYAWIYLADNTSGETIKRISMQVKCRPKPEGFDAPEDAEIFRDAIEAVNASADRAETAREGAEAAQRAAEAAAGKIEGEITGAGQIAEQVRRDAEAVAKDKQAVSQMVTETTQNAQNAASNAQAAERSSTAAKEAQTAAESAEAGAAAAMEEVERDRTEVSETHRAVEQLRGAVDTDRQAVAADRRAVENTALQFGQAAQNALTAVGQAQEAAVGAVSDEGQRQATAVQQAGTHAVSDVETAKTTAVQAVTTEGDTQVGRVQDAAAGIVADREQIAANKAGIEALHQGKADAIVETAQGETMTLTDSSDKLFRGLRVFGKSTQDGTPSVENPVPIVNAGENGSITVEVIGKNLWDKSKLSGGELVNFNGVECYKYPDGNAPFNFDLSWNKSTNLFTLTVRVFRDESHATKETFFKFIYDDGFIEHVKLSIGVINTKTSRDGKILKRITGSDNYNVNVYIDLSVTQLEYGTIPTPYEPYTHQSLTLATPNGLPGVPVSKDGNYTDQNGQQWVCDEVDLGRGKYVQRVKDIKLNGDTEISHGFHSNGNGYIGVSKIDAKKVNNLMSDRYIGGGWSDENGHFYAPDNKGIIVVDKRFTSLEEAKRIIGVEQPYFLYQLATPIERDLTPEELAAYEALHTNYPITVITNDAGAHMEVSYVADTGTYVRNMEERLNAKLVNIQSALISQKISGGGIKVADSARVPVVQFVMWGKTEQVRTSGKNLIDIPEIKAGTGNGRINCHISANTVFHARKDSVNVEKIIWRIAFNYKDGSIRYIKDDGFNSYYSVPATEDNPIESVDYRDSYIISGRYTDIQLEYGSSPTAYEPYTGGKPSPSPDYPQPIEITDQPVTVTVKGGTEQQSITLTPPKPMTKWDKLEKVDGVWCWVYQHKVLSGTEIAKKASGIHSYGALMASISGIGIAENQDNSVCNKLICPTKSVASLTYGEFRILYGNIYLKIDGVTTVEDGRQWLESNDIIIIAQASAPEFISLSPSEQAQLNALTMYAPETEVTNTGGCNMELTYTVDTKSYVDSKIAAISAAVLEV